MNHKIRIALLGICNSKNIVENKVLEDTIENIFYAFQPCYFDITNKNNGLNIPYSYFYKTPIGNAYKDPFTKKTMQMDLNKTTLTTIEALNPDYLLIDLGSINMKIWELSYNGKTVWGRNAFAPACYEDLKITLGDNFIFKEIQITEEDKLRAISNLYNYLINNWDLNKIILFIESVPKYFNINNKVEEITEKNYNRQWELYSIKSTIELSNIFLKKFDNKIKVFNDIENKIISFSESEDSLHNMPSAHHNSKETQIEQAKAFKNFILKI